MDSVNIREAALAGPRNLEAALAAAIKASESASAALEALTVSLMLAASFLNEPEPLNNELGECRHVHTIEVSTMGAVSIICDDCGDTVADAMHRG
jgi:hypothetical protein